MTARRWRRPSWFALALTAIGMLIFVRLGVWQPAAYGLFWLYVLLNFMPLIQQRLRVYRVVFEPRTVLKEMGTEIPENIPIRVYDSTADLRYLVLPVRPAGTEGWTAAQLEKLVTRDSMVGVIPASSP